MRALLAIAVLAIMAFVVLVMGQSLIFFAQVFPLDFSDLMPPLTIR